MAGNGKKVRFGMIGTGRVAQLHAQAMSRIAGAKLVAAWNRNAQKCRTFCDQYGCRIYDGAEQLLSDEAIDAVVIATISGTHFDFARRALLAGKHVMIEKPISETAGEIEDLEKIAKKTGLMCFPSHNYIYSEQMRSLKYHFGQGKLGRPLSYWCMFNNQHPPSFGDPDVVMRELMIHHVYSMLYFMGRPVSLVASAGNVHFSNPDAPDQIMITAKFAAGAIANLWGSFAVNDDRAREPWSLIFKILGTTGAASISWDTIKCGPEPEPLWDDMSYRDSFMHAQRYFVEECLGAGFSPLSTLRDAHDALCILNAARESILSGRRVDIQYRADLTKA
jgi:myo-inositol 2-dehydrogenase / D-chiro-inositol 1-dehydrogenase